MLTTSVTAFQVTDDILDVEADRTKSGKPANQDEKGESNFVSNGKDQAKQRAEMLVEQTISHLPSFRVAPECSNNWHIMC